MSDTDVWMPVGLSERLRVGAMVLVRMSPECRCKSCGIAHETEAKIDTTQPYKIVVIRSLGADHCWHCDGSFGNSGHFYGLMVDGRLSAFAAAELEPHDPTPAAGDAAEGV